MGNKGEQSGEIRVIDPEKLKAARGWMPQSEVARRTKGVYTQGAIWAIEAGKFRPRPENIPVLLEAYGAAWTDVSTPV